MPNYAAPIREMDFVLNRVAGLAEVTALPGCSEASPDLVLAVLAEAGRFAEDVLAPLNPVGDRQGSRRDGDGAVRTPDGFAQAYAQFVEGGWNALPFDPAHGGQGLPWLVSTAVSEIWHSANMAFALCPMLTQGAVELLQTHGSDRQKATFLPRLVSGEWTGTMCLTEPQAGSDLAPIRCRAVPEGDHYRITGQKIFISWGEHDVADNIVHMVLARTPDAPPGTKGLSLFIVPKFLVAEDGSLGRRNDLACVSLEHKLGIHASPTAVMSFGDQGGAVGYLVGEENRGLACMFTMMNNARLAVGLQGVAIAERAYQRARAYASERVQGLPPGCPPAGLPPIIHHPDVRRMLMGMKAKTEAARALAYYTAARLDVARHHPDAGCRRDAQARVDLLIPVVKAWCTDLGIQVADSGVQVHGGMGYIEETGAAQHLRDARITAIYEGTNGIQAMDLVGRKLRRDGGRALAALIAEMRGEGGADPRFGRALQALSQAADTVLAADEIGAGAAAYPFLTLLGIVAGGWLMGRAATAAKADLAAGVGDASYLRGKLTSARFYAETMLPQASALAETIACGPEATMALAEDEL